jgi:hypothetical protein
MLTPRSPITISDENARFPGDGHPNAVAGPTSFDEDHTPDVSMSFDDPLAAQNAKLMDNVGRLEHIVAEKEVTIAALNAMLKRQSMAPDVRTKPTAPNTPATGGKNRFQQQYDEFINIGLWLEQKKKSEMEKDVQQLKDTNEELGAQLEEERQKSQALERDKYNMQCMIEHLEREKKKT